MYDGPINKESIAEFAKTEYGFEPSGQVQNEPQTELEQPVQDDARSRVAALDANSTSEIPLGSNEELVAALRGASVKDSLRAKLNYMDQEQQKK